MCLHVQDDLIFQTRPGMGSFVRSIQKRVSRIAVSQDVVLGCPLPLPSAVMLLHKIFCVISQPTVSVASLVGDFSNGFPGDAVAAAEDGLVRSDFVETSSYGGSGGIFDHDFVPSLGRPLCLLSNFSDSSELGFVEPVHGSLYGGNDCGRWFVNLHQEANHAD